MRLRFPRQTEVQTGSTALHVAAGAGQLDAVKLLVENGADVHAKTDKGISVLDMAKRYGMRGQEVVAFLESAMQAVSAGVIATPIPVGRLVSES